MLIKLSDRSPQIYIAFACCIPSFLTLVTFAVYHRQRDYNVSSHTYHCYVRDGLVIILTRYIPFMLCMVIGICLGGKASILTLVICALDSYLVTISNIRAFIKIVHATWNLITYRQKFERENSFKSMAIPAGLCLRVIMFCVLLFIITSSKVSKSPLVSITFRYARTK